jgi:hypothetical protein
VIAIDAQQADVILQRRAFLVAAKDAERFRAASRDRGEYRGS